jgi:PPK2 family polyphosphate:nucleotide phosphotransferase
MTIKTKHLRVKAGTAVRLKHWPTRVDPVYASKQGYEELLAEHVARLSQQQELLYASNSHALLIIFQAMDAAGKDGAIKHVMSGVNPQGCQVFSFSHPSAEELKHDFLWRPARYLPERGKIGIFNRSYYEEVLIVRVHPEILKAEALADASNQPQDIWRQRYESIAGFERHLTNNGTRIVKIFLHLSKEEQRVRLQERIDTPQKTWKISPDDLKERAYWKQYRKAYEDCLSATSSVAAPWYIVPADDKPNARVLVSRIILEALEELKMAYPKPTAKRRAELTEMRKQLQRD